MAEIDPAALPAIAILDIGAKVHSVANQSIVGGFVTQLVTFDTVEYDTNTMWTPPDTLIIVTAGKYKLFGHVLWASTADASAIEIQIRKSGVILAVDHREGTTIVVQTMGQGVCTEVDCTVGDTITMVAAQTHGAALARTIIGATSPWTAMGARKVA